MENMQFEFADEEIVRAEVLQEKCATLSSLPGVELTFDPHEADMSGAFREDALSEADARNAVFDEEPEG